MNPSRGKLLRRAIELRKRFPETTSGFRLDRGRERFMIRDRPRW